MNRSNRVASVVLKTLKGHTHTRDSPRLQLVHDQSSPLVTVSDSSSVFTGVSIATQQKLFLQWSRMIVYFGTGNSFLFCFRKSLFYCNSLASFMILGSQDTVTDDISIQADIDRKVVTLHPRREKALSLKRSPKAVKAKIIGSRDDKGGIRLDKECMSPDDQDEFEEYASIQLLWKEKESKYSF